MRYLFFVLLLFFSCKKSEPVQKSDCELNNYGYLVVSNSSANSYDIYIDGVVKTRIKGGTVVTDIRISVGNSRKLKAVQVDGYILYPTEKLSDLNVLPCSKYSWQIP